MCVDLAKIKNYRVDKFVSLELNKDLFVLVKLQIIDLFIYLNGNNS